MALSTPTARTTRTQKAGVFHFGFLFYRHTLCEILRFIDISPQRFRNPNSKSPEWDEREKRREERMRCRHLDTVIIEIVHIVSGSDDTEDFSISSFDLFDV
jgi:hypothetical protein